ncbi:hypothetical protein V2J94_46530 [Streptomyces sp. DSM 41524]|uniref:Uncharacterized protein n=1 Tax=Streptomyces asiaticus subsp. ignotus TaxID=3098222 RepID=A0ABU7QD40_9ACTN|nr:hypothetical protein [Streptomyces sp. DSM 41524]
MRKQLEKIGSKLLDRLVPQLEASAASQACEYCYRCVRGTGCSDGTYWQVRLECNDGNTAWHYDSCGPCSPSSYFCV